MGPFDLADLKRFNHALVYGFDPESSIKDFKSSSLAYLAHSVGQWKDVFAAYCYAADTILPAIEKQGIKNITPRQLLTWLNEIHLRIASTLAKDQGVSAGEFTQNYGARWHNGNIIEDIIYIYLSQDMNFLTQSYVYLLPRIPRENFDSFGRQIRSVKNFRALCLKLLGAFGVEEADAQDFLELLDRIVNDDSMKIASGMRGANQLNLSNEKAEASLAKFRFWYSDKKPTDSERTIVKKIVTPFLPPEEIPQVMQNFAEDLLEEWSVCDPNNQDQLAKLLCDAFYNLSGEIHPYFNANGRTATCLVNIILVSLGQPSILLRNPKERDDPNSSYSMAIKHSGSEPVFLINHFKQRIQEAKEGKSYSNPALEQLVCLRVKLSDKACALREQFPRAEIEQFNAMLQKQVVQKFTVDANNPDAYGIVCLQFFLEEFDKFGLQQLLKKYGLVGSADWEKVLRQAANNGNHQDIELLIKAVPTIDINKKDGNEKSGKTALHWAVIKNHPECVEVLLKHGASKDISDNTVSKMTSEQYAEKDNNEVVLRLLARDYVSVVRKP